MLSFDNTVNLLMQSKYRYQLQDVADTCRCRCRTRSG